MPLCVLKRGTAFLIVGGLLWPWAVRAESPDPLGAIGRYYLPIPAPSADTSPRTFVMNGRTYVIPWNYIEGLNADDDVADGNSFYYNFDRKKLCEWPSIRNRAGRLIISFKTESAE
jgi:hypothetical protein